MCRVDLFCSELILCYARCVLWVWALVSCYSFSELKCAICLPLRYDLSFLLSWSFLVFMFFNFLTADTLHVLFFFFLCPTFQLMHSQLLMYLPEHIIFSSFSVFLFIWLPNLHVAATSSNSCGCEIVWLDIILIVKWTPCSMCKVEFCTQMSCKIVCARK